MKSNQYVHHRDYNEPMKTSCLTTSLMTTTTNLEPMLEK